MAKGTEIGWVEVEVTTTPTPPNKPKRKERVRDLTFVKVLRRKKPIADKPQEPRPLSFAIDAGLKDKAAALAWIKDNGNEDYEYVPVRCLSDWRTVTVETTEVRSLK